MNILAAFNLASFQDQLDWLLPVGTICLFIAILGVISWKSPNTTFVAISVVSMVLLGGLGMAMLGFSFRKDALTNVAAVLPAVMIVAILIERTAEIFLTIWRGGDAVVKEEEYRRLVELEASSAERTARLQALPQEIANAAPGGATPDPTQHQKLKDEKQRLDAEDTERHRLQTAQVNGVTQTLDIRKRDLENYKNETRNRAFVFTFALGLLLAACGFRVVEAFVEVPKEWQAGARAKVEEKLKEQDNARAQASAVAGDLLKLVKADRTARKESDAALRESKDLDDKIKTAKPEELQALLARIKANAPKLAGAEKDEDQHDKELGTSLEEALLKGAKAERPAADRSAELATAALSVPGSGQMLAFHFFDILLSAGLLAGGADPISRLMKLLRDLIDQTNKQMTEKK